MKWHRQILIPDHEPKRTDPVTEREWRIFIIVLYILALGWLVWMLAEPETNIHLIEPREDDLQLRPESKGYYQHKTELTRV